MPVRRIVLAVVLTLGMLSGCSASPDISEPLPTGQSLIDTAAGGLQDLESVNFTFHVNGAVPGLPVRKVEGVAHRQGGQYGYARGVADVQRITDRTQYEFLLSGDTLRLTDDGAQEEQALPERFSPARILAPDTGLHRLLDEATNLETEGREDLDDVPTYRVDGELSREVVAMLIPAVRADVDVKFWVRQAEEPDLMRIWMQLPPQQQNAGAVTLELALSNHNSPAEPTVQS